MNNQSEKS